MTNGKLEFDVVESWLCTVAHSHSNSSQTRVMYEVNFQKFLDFVEKSAAEIVLEYENSDDRHFKRRYGQYVKALISVLQKRGYAPASITTIIGTIKSFFKYNDLPLGFIPSGSRLIEFHNRDITREEVVEVLKLANVRDRAFFTVMAQSGLRPGTISGLRIKDVEKILDEDAPVPATVKVNQENTKGKFQGYFSFVGEEAIAHVKDYLKTREKLTPEDYLFTKFGHNDKPISPSVMTHIFRRIVLKLRQKGLMKFETPRKEMQIETKNHKPLRSSVSRSEIRLYNLRKFFRKYAGQAGNDYVNYWMGHTSALGVDLHYFSRDIEHHKQIYREKAMPHLRLETSTPSETDKIIQKQAEEIKGLKTRLDEIMLSRNQVQELLRRIEKLEKQAQK